MAAHPLVVEFLGISGSGKSTLARSLAARFERQGYRAKLVTMQRPTVSGRLIGILSKSANLCRFALCYWDEFGDARSILKLFPQKSTLASTRLLSYLTYIVAIRLRTTIDFQAVIFDQGIAQAVYSLSLFSSQNRDGAYAEALNILPAPHILIILDVPTHTASKRLVQRRGLAKVARITDYDKKIMEASTDAIKEIGSRLAASGCRVIHYRPRRSATVEESTDDLFRTLWPTVWRAGSRGGCLYTQSEARA